MTKKGEKQVIYICSSCGEEFLKWSGRCAVCGAWNSLKEGARILGKESGREKRKGQATPIALKTVNPKDFERIITNIEEFDRVLGAGIVPGSLILLAGDPGIGKSTLLLQIVDRISQQSTVNSQQSILYVSGEESAQQIKIRADRLNINSENIYILAETDLENVLEAIERLNPRLIVIDSIQTMYLPQLPSTPGSVTQVRESAVSLMEVAKTKNIPIILVGHVTKEGSVAGPRVLEHLVDVVLYLEGDRYESFRILRGVKNRFGSTNEIGVFMMKSEGLEEVKNPSQLFLKKRKSGISGSAITAVIEGSRSFLIELQALVNPTNFGYPKRTASGFSLNRLQLLIAVLDKRVGINLGGADIFLNSIGGLKINEPAADLAGAVAIYSAYKNKPVDSKIVFIGEVGLSGEIFIVPQIEKRIEEAKKLGFEKIIVPFFNGTKNLNKSKIKIIEVETLKEVFNEYI